MSCHCVGEAINETVAHIMNLYFEEKITKEIAMDLIRWCKHSVNVCDGNEYEAIECFEDCLCGKCLNIIPEKGKLYSLYDLSTYDVAKSCDTAAPYLCKNCFDEVVNNYYQDKHAGEREREKLEKQGLFYESIGEWKYKED